MSGRRTCVWLMLGKDLAGAMSVSHFLKKTVGTTECSTRTAHAMRYRAVPETACCVGASQQIISSQDRYGEVGFWDAVRRVLSRQHRQIIDTTTTASRFFYNGHLRQQWHTKCKCLYCPVLYCTCSFSRCPVAFCRCPVALSARATVAPTQIQMECVHPQGVVDALGT